MPKTKAKTKAPPTRTASACDLAKSELVEKHAILATTMDFYGCLAGTGKLHG